MTENERQIRKACEEYLKSYFSRRDINGIIEILSKKYTVIGTGKDEFATEYLRGIELFKRDLSQAPETVETTIHQFVIEEITSDTGIVLLSLDLKTVIDKSPLELSNLRASLFFNRENGKWLIRHIHISLPFFDQEVEESYPLKELEKQNKLLEELVSDKTDELKKLMKTLSGLTN